MDRRKFLVGSGATLAAVAGLSKTEKALAAQYNVPGYSDRDQSNPQPLITQSNDLTPYSGAWTDTTLRHLLRRAMFGVPHTQFEAALALGNMTKVVDKLLEDRPEPSKPAAYVDSIIVPDQNASEAEKMAAGNLERVKAAQVINWWMDLIVKEDLSIRERMTLLWSNHFVVGADVVPYTAFLYTYNQTLRANALGNLKTFARAISIDPGMLIYLNGAQNYDGKPPGTNRKSGTNINENYARELQELFCLGLTDPKSGKPNYTEDDVQQAAKALTGWFPTITSPFIGKFYPESHNNGNKTFLGQTGNWGLDDIINIIFNYKGPDGTNSPGFNAAYWFCQKMYMEFVYYVPNDSVVTAMAELMVQSNFEIKPVMKALLQSDHFYDANVMNSQLKSPINFMASIIREFGVTYTAFDPVDPPKGQLDKNGVQTFTDPNISISYIALQAAGIALGQILLQPPNVKGWPGAHNWISTGTFQQREQLAGALLVNPPYFDGSVKAKGIKIGFQTPMAWAQGLPGIQSMTSEEISAAITSIALNKTLGPKESASLYSVLNPLKLPENDFYLTDKDVSNFVIFLTNLPEFQLA